MANRQSAPTGARADAREDTARVMMHKTTLPGWFWGALGCLSVLAVGFGALLVVAKKGVVGGFVQSPVAAATALPPAGQAPPSGPQIEPLAPPPAPALLPSVEPKPRMPQPHPIKLARSPSGLHAPAAAPAPPGAGDKADDKPAAADDTAPVKKPADKAAQGDDDQTVHVHHNTAADEDDEDSDN